MDMGELQRLVGEAMLRDQWGFRRRLDALRNRMGKGHMGVVGVDELAAQIGMSVALRKRWPLASSSARSSRKL